MAQPGSSNKVANKLVALASAAVLAVYAAGYTRTRAAAERLDAQTEERRPAGASGRGVPPATPIHLPVPDAGHDADTLIASVEPAKTIATPLPPPAAGQPAQASQKVAPEPKADTVSLASNPSAVTTTVPAPTPVSPVATPAPSAPVQTASITPVPVPMPTAPVQSASIAPTPAPAPAPASAVPAAAKWKDGTYTGWGTCRHGDIQAQVIIESGRIKSATIAQCLTRYSCSVISPLPPEVVQRQSPETDYVSGATQSTNAFYYAVTEALGKAK